MSRTRHPALGLMLAGLLLPVAACGGEEDEATPLETRTDGQVDAAGQPEADGRAARTGWAVAAAHPLATEAGAAVLREGGSVVDAAIAIQAVLGLAEPQSSGLGGGAFMLVYDAEAGKIVSYDGREVAPYTAGPDLFLDPTGDPLGFREAIDTGRAVGVPGLVAMLDLAHREYGRLPWEDLFADAERLARDGFTVTPRLAGLLSEYADSLSRDEMARGIYFHSDGSPLAEGDTLVNAAYANTVDTIATSGAAAFYSGEIADEIVEAVNARAADEDLISAEDLATYEPVRREPVCAPFRSHEVCTMGPPSSGLAMLQMLGTMEAAGLPETPGGDLWALYAEAGRLAFADRALYVGDPSGMGVGDVSANAIVSGLTDPLYFADRARAIGANAAKTVTAGNPTDTDLRSILGVDTNQGSPGTSHFSVRDVYGNVLSMTTTVEGAFGSDIMAGGMFLNNELTDFAFRPMDDGRQVVNAPEPGKRPRSSMTPTIVLDADGDPVVAIGSAGGPTIISHVAKTLALTLGYDVPLQDAIEAPHVVVVGNRVILEEGAPQDLVGALEAFGLSPLMFSQRSSLYGFTIDGETIAPGVDPRREGTFMSGD